MKLACETCEAADYEPSPWFSHIWFLYSLQRAGYPFKKDDLSLEEWMDLGAMKEHMDAHKRGLKIG